MWTLSTWAHRMVSITYRRLWEPIYIYNRCLSSHPYQENKAFVSPTRNVIWCSFDFVHSVTQPFDIPYLILDMLFIHWTGIWPKFRVVFAPRSTMFRLTFRCVLLPCHGADPTNIQFNIIHINPTLLWVQNYFWNCRWYWEGHPWNVSKKPRQQATSPQRGGFNPGWPPTSAVQIRMVFLKNVTFRVKVWTLI